MTLTKYTQDRFIKHMMLFAGVCALLFLNLASGVLIKISPMFHSDFISLSMLFLLLLVTYAFRSLLWLVLGKRYQLSFVHPLLSINYVLSLFIGIVFFEEPFRLGRFVGSLIILCGVVVLFFSKEQREDEILP